MKLASSNPAGTLEFATRERYATLSRAVKTGRAIRLAPGIVAHGATLDPARVASHHKFAIISHEWPGAVVCDASALTGAHPTDGWLFVCHPNPLRKSDLHLPGLSISARAGPGPLPEDMPLPEGLFMSGPVRTLVDNVSLGGRQPKGRPSRTAGVEAVEDRIDTDARSGASRIRSHLTNLDTIADQLPAKSVDLVRRRLAEVLGTFTGAADAPRSSRLRARLANRPYDQHRIDLFTKFAHMLARTAPELRPAFGPPSRWQWLPFFEAYFSNFIEGTEFGVDEAKSIAIDGIEPAGRPQDAHDIAATYRIVQDPQLNRAVAGSGTDLLNMLRTQHSILMEGRLDKRPGEFTAQQNYAGGYAFVAPELTEGTLLHGFDCFDQVTDPFHRAAALMFLITECHPFADGNGRTARLIANATLTAGGQVRLVIPTVYRDNYLIGLSAASNGAGHGAGLLDVLAFVQKWAALVNWEHFDQANEQVARSNAYLDAALAERSGQRLRFPERHSV